LAQTGEKRDAYRALEERNYLEGLGVDESIT
jgi:hypothetical protein